MVRAAAACFVVVAWLLYDTTQDVEYSGIYLKRHSHTDFNSYVVGTECETKDLQSELSHRICSPPHGKISEKRVRQWPPGQLILRDRFLKPYQPKSCDRLGMHLSYRLGPLGWWGFHHEKKDLISECFINLTTACSLYQDKWICDETWYRLLSAHYPN
jgi:hypothetical protein